MEEKSFKYEKNLLDRYNNGNCTEEEVRMVEAWFNYQAKANENLAEPEDIDMIGREIWATLHNKTKIVKRNLWLRVAAAAAVVFALAFIFKLYNAQLSNQPYLAKIKKEKISPGTFGATLTLASGKKVNLSELDKGIFAQEAGLTISKTAQGELVYEVKNGPSNIIANNTLSTAKGETFKVNLPDGSSVWLNAASSLTYSTNLANESIRSVSLNGEGYFKVSHDAEHPFVVKTSGQEIRVLGTEFNVSSYSNDAAETTTLLNGKIMMKTASQQIILAPGEKGVVRSGAIQKSAADTDVAIGWKNNEFVFRSQDIRSILKLVARWYDVDISYDGEIPQEQISGSISRFADIHSVLNILQATGAVKIKIDGNKVIVTDSHK